MRSDFQDNILEMALTPYFLPYFWLATRLPPEKCEFMENKRGLCLGSQAGLSCEIGVCPKGSHVGSWLSVEDTDAQNSPLSPAPTSSRSSAALSPPSPPPPSAPSYLLFRPVSVGKSLIHMEAVFLRLLANIEITQGWGELIKKSRFLGFILGRSESVALGRAQKLPFDRFSDGGDPCLHLRSPLALQNKQGHLGKCVKQIWK